MGLLVMVQDRLVGDGPVWLVGDGPVWLVRDGPVWTCP